MVSIRLVRSSKVVNQLAAIRVGFYQLLTFFTTFLEFLMRFLLKSIYITIFSDGCLGSGNDEGRSKMR
jgi:hypothetical protein